ncbi:MAG: PBP1A family penicillin-binding protein [Aerococcus sp.]|nr:PBP1A family penicillin-binding protein [Aerococcus sp.]
MWKSILLGALAVMVVIGLTGVAVGITWIAGSPELTKADLTGTIASVVYDKDGKEIYETSKNEQTIVGQDEISSQIFDAVTSIEDRRFEEHHGIDPVRIIGSFVANLKAGGIAQGGSTLTQQLVKLSVFSTQDKDRTYKRKLQEIWLAMQVERHYSKSDIFQFYLNKVYMANGVYGIGTAAEIYYGKALKELSLDQSAMLAGMPQAPNEYNPYTHPDKAKERRDTVLKAMLENNKITEAEYNEALAQPIDHDLQPLKEITDEATEQDQVVDAYIKQVAAEIKEKGYDLFSDGLKVYTHLDLDAQQYMYDTVNDTNGVYFPNANMQAAISVLDTKTGNIVALFGGRNQNTQLGLNRATEINRSVGSTIKPFADYGPAFEYLNYSPGQTIKDEPYQYSSGDEINNWDNSYQGTITLRQALIQSRNIPALKLFQKVGTDHVNEFLGKLNIKMNGDHGVYESNAIGGEISPLNLSAAYATLGNYGEYNQPRAVDYFTTRDDQKVQISKDTHRAMKDSTAYMLTDVLKDNFTDAGLAGNIANANIIQAGKTGTTNYTKQEQQKNNIPESGVPDSWMAGYSTSYSTAIWIGYDQPFSENGYLTGADQGIAKQLYADIMSHLHANIPANDWEQPDSVHQVALAFGSDPLQLASATSGYGVVNDLVNNTLYKELQKRQPTTGSPVPYSSGTQNNFYAPYSSTSSFSSSVTSDGQSAQSGSSQIQNSQNSEVESSASPGSNPNTSGGNTPPSSNQQNQRASDRDAA